MKTYAYSVTVYLTIQATSTEDAERQVNAFLVGGPQESYILGDGMETTTCAVCGCSDEDGHTDECVDGNDDEEDSDA